MSYDVWGCNPTSFSQPFTPTNDMRIDGVMVKIATIGDPTFTSVSMSIVDGISTTLATSAVRTKSSILGSNTTGILISAAFTFANSPLLEGGQAYKLTGAWVGDSFTTSARADFVLNWPDTTNTASAGAVTFENLLVFPYNVQFIRGEEL